MTIVRRLVLGSLFCLGIVAELHSQTTLKFVARAAQVPGHQDAAGEHNWSPGHAFIIMTHHTRIGLKEEIYGFYPRQNGKGAIFGPGMLRSEFRCGAANDCVKDYNELKRLSESIESTELPISLDQRRAVYAEINRWNDKNYAFAGQNCVSFVSEVVVALGFQRVSWTDGLTPAQFVRSLKTQLDSQVAEKARREAEERARRQAEERARREGEERARREAEERARREAEERARREAEERRRQAATPAPSPIPNGWVVCHCPNQHSFTGSSGKWFNGLFYHSDSTDWPVCH